MENNQNSSGYSNMNHFLAYVESYANFFECVVIRDKKLLAVVIRVGFFKIDSEYLFITFFIPFKQSWFLVNR
jgi:hypothetical protein